jgi:hypothetical protein
VCTSPCNARAPKRGRPRERIRDTAPMARRRSQTDPFGFSRSQTPGANGSVAPHRRLDARGERIRCSPPTPRRPGQTDPLLPTDASTPGARQDVPVRAPHVGSPLAADARTGPGTVFVRYTARWIPSSSGRHRPEGGRPCCVGMVQIGRDGRTHAGTTLERLGPRCASPLTFSSCREARDGRWLTGRYRGSQRRASCCLWCAPRPS